MIELKRNNIRAKTNNKPWKKKRPLICVCWATVKKSKTTYSFYLLLERWLALRHGLG
jgi:hypothetical protein